MKEVHDAHDRLSAALEDSDCSNEEVRDAAVALCDALNAMYAAPAKAKVLIRIDGGSLNEVRSTQFGMDFRLFDDDLLTEQGLTCDERDHKWRQLCKDYPHQIRERDLETRGEPK